MRRADELDLAVAADLGEVGVLRQEAVAGMDGLDVGDLGGADDARDVQVALGGRRPGRCRWPRRPASRYGAPRSASLKTATDLDAQVAAGADDPQGDLAAIGYQDALEHSVRVQSQRCRVAD